MRPVFHLLPILLALLYTTAVAAPLVAAAAFALMVISRGDARGRTLAVALVITAALFPLLYRGAPPSVGDPPALAWELLQQGLRVFTVSARGVAGHEETVVAILLFAVLGAIDLWRRERRTAVILLSAAILPIVITVGAALLLDHLFAFRYVVASLPPFLLLVAAGIAMLARFAASIVRVPAAGTTVAVLLAAAIGWRTWSAARTEPFQKLDWRAIAAALERHVQPGDLILTAEAWSNASLHHYLRKLPPTVRVAHVPYVPMAEILTQTTPAVWMISAGSSPDHAVRDWMCRFPRLLGSPLEDFRLHYAPSSRHFARERSGPAQLRALDAALGDGFTLNAGENDEFFLGEGWSDADHVGQETYRWAVAEEATLHVPGRRGSSIAVHALPLRHASLAAQTMRVMLNGAVLGEVTLHDEWRDYRFDAPADLWREGWNEVAFGFGRTTSPMTFDPASKDPRTLAVLFESITIGEPAPLPAFRLWLPLDRASVPTEPRALLGRLGFPGGNLRDAVESLAHGGPCEDDRAFLSRAFALLLNRQPNAIEQRDLLARLRQGDTRTHIVHRIMRADDSPVKQWDEWE